MEALLVIKRIWRIKPKPAGLSLEDQSQLGISSILANMLARRGVCDLKSARLFLEGALAQLHSPMHLAQMDKAVQRLSEAIEKQELILVYGDYDVDGITSTALVLRTLRGAGVRKIIYYIPKRLEEGYGLHRETLEKAVKNGCRLVITVDCGISGVEEAEYLREQGVDLIITDHHEPPEILPPAYAIINPKLLSSEYPWPELAGVGVAFKFLQALAENMPEVTECLYENLDLVAMGTIGDVVPLLDENRILVREGLKRLAKTTNIGLQALLKQLRLDSNTTAEQVAYVIAPRINATGRLNAPTVALQLFLTNDPSVARRLAEELDLANRERQAIEERVLNEALSMLETDYNPERDRVIVLAGEGWHPGVIGIVASRIVDRYYRPTVMIGLEAGVGRGSARGIPGFNWFKALQACDPLLERYGGHEMAAGLTIKAQQIDELRETLNRNAAQTLGTDALQPFLTVEDRVELPLITLDLARELMRLAPFGSGNPAPILICHDIKVIHGRAVGENSRHLKLKISDGTVTRDGIGFGFGELTDEVVQAGRVDLAFCVGENTWNAVTDVQLVIKDLKIQALTKEETA
jgi:single-stranded-DNA-specific exonuclease